MEQWYLEMLLGASCFVCFYCYFDMCGTCSDGMHTLIAFSVEINTLYHHVMPLSISQIRKSTQAQMSSTQAQVPSMQAQVPSTQKSNNTQAQVQSTQAQVWHPCHRSLNEIMVCWGTIRGTRATTNGGVTGALWHMCPVARVPHYFL